MGMYDWLFKTQEEGGGFVEIPLKPEQKEALKFLEGLFKKGAGEVFEPAEVAGLTGIEKLAQEIAEKYVREGVPELREATELVGRTAREPVDIRKLPEYRGAFRDILETGQRESARLGRSLQITGGATTAGGRDILGRSITGTQERLATAASSFAEAERQRKERATLNLANLGITGVQMPLEIAKTTGALPRALTQQELDNIYNAARMTQTFKYGPPAGIAAGILGETFYGYKEPTLSPSIFSQVASAIPFSGTAYNPQGGGMQTMNPQNVRNPSSLSPGYSYPGSYTSGF